MLAGKQYQSKLQAGPAAMWYNEDLDSNTSCNHKTGFQITVQAELSNVPPWFLYVILCSYGEVNILRGCLHSHVSQRSTESPKSKEIALSSLFDIDLADVVGIILTCLSFVYSKQYAIRISHCWHRRKNYHAISQRLSMGALHPFV